MRSTMGFAGFRILYPLNKPGDELGRVPRRELLPLPLPARGLRPFRPGPRDQHRGARAARSSRCSACSGWSARCRTRRPSSCTPSSTARARPAPSGSRSRPGADTVTEVHEVLYCRRNPAVLGIAPLTSMFWHGKNTNASYDDFRPEVHDSDGLMIYTGAGEWIWRPLTNPNAPRIASFSDENPKGVRADPARPPVRGLPGPRGLLPHAPERLGGARRAGGAGARVRLVELHGPDETADNIMAFWVPESLPQAGEPIELSYRLHWFMDQIHPPAGYAVATRHGRTRTQETELERFVVDFDGAYLGKQGPDPLIEPVVTVGRGRVARELDGPEEPVQRHVEGGVRASSPTGPAGPSSCAASCGSRPTCSRRRGATCGSRELRARGRAAAGRAARGLPPEDGHDGVLERGLRARRGLPEGPPDPQPAPPEPADPEDPRAGGQAPRGAPGARPDDDRRRGDRGG